MPNPAVEIHDLRMRYGSRVALAGLDLTAARGAVTAVLGPNGAGKTTALEICSGLRRPDAGSVRVLGLDPRGESAALRPRIGVMLQAGGIYSGARPAEMLRHVAALHAHPLDPAALIDLLGLGHLRRTSYRRMSGGEKQLLALGLALVGRPELAFLDEPTAGLDPHARRRTWELIRALRTDGVSVVLTTHLMDEAEALADHVHIIDQGRVVAAGTPRELTDSTGLDPLSFRAPAGLPVETLTAALHGDAVATEPRPGHYSVSGPADPVALAAVTAWCAGLGVMPEGLSVARRSLEDVFLELTGRELSA